MAFARQLPPLDPDLARKALEFYRDVRRIDQTETEQLKAEIAAMQRRQDTSGDGAGWLLFDLGAGGGGDGGGGGGD